MVFALKKVPYEVIDVRTDERKSLLEYTNQRKVPTVNYNGECVIDSTVISARLEKDHPQNSIYPDGANNKGLCLAIEDWSDEVLIHANHAMRRADNSGGASKKPRPSGIATSKPWTRCMPARNSSSTTDDPCRHLDLFAAALSLYHGEIRCPGASIKTSTRFWKTCARR